MANFAQALKAEIVRLSRKESKAASDPIRKTVAHLRASVNQLKGTVSRLESENKRLLALQKDNLRPQVPPEEMERARFTSKTVKALRERKGLSQADMARLLDMSTQGVFAMEHKAGRLRLRSSTIAGLVEIRSMGKRDLKKRLSELEEKKE